MSKVRDNAKRNMRRRFATEHSDGSPVGAYIVVFQDGCAEAINGYGDCFAGMYDTTHEPDSHTRENWLLRRRYTHDAWDDLTTHHPDLDADLVTS
jgi:hypothetical protein